MNYEEFNFLADSKVVNNVDIQCLGVWEFKTECILQPNGSH